MFVSFTFFLLHEAFPLLQIFQFMSGVFRLTCIYTHHQGRVAAEEGNRKKFACSMLFCSVRIYPCSFKTRFCFACFPWTSVRRKMPCIMSLKNKSLRFPVNRASQTFILSDAASGILRHFRAQLEHSSFSRQQRSFFPLDAMQETVTFPVCRSPLDRAPGPWGGSFRRARECPRAVFRKAFRPRRPHRWPPGDSGQKHCRHRFQEALNA